MCPSASDIVEKFRSKYRSLNDVKAAFKRFDRNGDGALSKDELAAAMKSSGDSYSDVEVNAIFSLGDGEITPEEFWHPDEPIFIQHSSETQKTIQEHD